jgi:hypothetical protein
VYTTTLGRVCAVGVGEETLQDNFNIRNASSTLKYTREQGARLCSSYEKIGTVELGNVYITEIWRTPFAFALARILFASGKRRMPTRVARA